MWLYDKYPDEDAFRTSFIRPLLNRMGFSSVAIKHGAHEFGKDFVFSEMTRFGGFRHYATQVKHEESINQGVIVDKLLSQIRQCFNVPFVLPDSPRERYVSAVYVFNSGRITDGAVTQMLGALRSEKYTDNVHFYCGERLSAINQWTTYQEDRNARQRLLGLQMQLTLNDTIWADMRKVATSGSFFEFRRSFLHGIEEFLSSPVSPELVSADVLMTIWQTAAQINALFQRRLGLGTGPGDRPKELAVAINLSNILLNHSAVLRTQIDLAIETLKPLEL